MTKKLPPMDRECSFCGKTFLSTHLLRKRCSEACRKADENKRSLAQYYKTHEPSKMKTLKCIYCGVDFDTKRWDKVYCCTAHRILDERRRLRTETPKDKKREPKKGGWTVRDRRAYGSRYWKEVIKPKLKRLREAEEAALAIADSKIPAPLIQRIPPEKIIKNWDKII